MAEEDVSKVEGEAKEAQVPKKKERFREEEEQKKEKNQPRKRKKRNSMKPMSQMISLQVFERLQQAADRPTSAAQSDFHRHRDRQGGALQTDLMDDRIDCG